MMKKTLIASAIALTTLAGTAQADITISNMDFNSVYAASGTLNAAGTGTMNSIDPFFGNAWSATQQTGYITNASGSFVGASGLGAYDFSTDIANMTDAQVGVGVYFNWNGNNDIAVLAVFECAAGVCSGAATGEAGYTFAGMQTPPFQGAAPLFNGTGSADVVSAVPVPAAVWLFGSGLVGLAGVARRRKAA